VVTLSQPVFGIVTPMGISLTVAYTGLQSAQINPDVLRVCGALGL